MWTDSWLLGLISAVCKNTSLQHPEHVRPRILGCSCLVFNSIRRLVASSPFISAQGENRASSREKFETGTTTSRAEPTPLFDLNLQPSTSWIGRLRAETSWTTCRSLEMKLFGVAAMLDIGRISVRGSVKAHSSIYRRHSGAQGRSQHYKSGTGTLVESESWLAMADCLGRFGRASHSNPRYHSPTQNFGQVQMHAQRNFLRFLPSDQAVLHLHAVCHLARPTAILQSSCRAYAPIDCLFARRILQDVLPAIRPREFACLSQADAPSGAARKPIRPAIIDARDPECW
jgi:hypothetical protein